MPAEIKSVHDRVLEACNNGTFHKDLKILYQAQYRDLVDWSLFPWWAVPNAEVEGCHEG
jgi:hypothetical protein